MQRFPRKIFPDFHSQRLNAPLNPPARNQMGEGRSPAGCDTLPMFDVLEAQEKETGNEED